MLIFSVGFQLNDPQLIMDIFVDCKDPVMQKQLAFMLGRHQHFLAVRNFKCVFFSSSKSAFAF
jgi:hypothetical protein